MNNKEIIEELKSLNLSTLPYDKVRSLISQFAPMFVRMTTQGPILVERLRSGIGYTERSEVSYKPGNPGDSLNRATIPGRSVFYGTLAHHEESPLNRRYIALCETSYLLNKGSVETCTEKYTLSIWGAKRPLQLGFIVNDKIFENRKNLLLQEAKAFRNSNRTFIERPLGYDDYIDFVTEQFSMTVDSNEKYKYIIPATIADYMMYASGLDGVVYPSVKANGHAGMNIALKKECVDDALVLLNVEELELKLDRGNASLRMIRQKPSKISSRDNYGLVNWVW